MGRRKRMTPVQKSLLQTVDEILWVHWDPLGLNDEPLCRSEYSSYALPVFGLLLRGAGVRELADRLAEIEREMMGLPAADMPRLEAVADMLDAARRQTGVC